MRFGWRNDQTIGVKNQIPKTHHYIRETDASLSNMWDDERCKVTLTKMDMKVGWLDHFELEGGSHL
jgi:hypothetical protein